MPWVIMVLLLLKTKRSIKYQGVFETISGMRMELTYLTMPWVIMVLLLLWTIKWYIKYQGLFEPISGM